MRKNEQKLLALTVISTGILLISNLAATKIWNFYEVPVDGGIIVFPIAYVIGDIIVELYGRKTANFIVWLGFCLNLTAGIVFTLVDKLPAYPNWPGSEAFGIIFGLAPRIMLGSLLAYFASGLMNNLVFEKIRQKTGEKMLYARSLGSSALARLIDTAVFEAIAFFGILSMGEFLRQATFAYTAGMVLEVLLTPITYLAVKALRNKCP